MRLLDASFLFFTAAALQAPLVYEKIPSWRKWLHATHPAYPRPQDAHGVTKRVAATQAGQAASHLSEKLAQMQQQVDSLKGDKQELLTAISSLLNNKQETSLQHRLEAEALAKDSAEYRSHILQKQLDLQRAFEMNLTRTQTTLKSQLNVSEQELTAEIARLREGLLAAVSEANNERRKSKFDLESLALREDRMRHALVEKFTSEYTSLATRSNTTLRELKEANEKRKEAKEYESELLRRGNELLRSNTQLQNKLTSSGSKVLELQEDKAHLLVTVREVLKESKGLKALVGALQETAKANKSREDMRVKSLQAKLEEQAKERLNLTAALANAERKEHAEQTQIAQLSAVVSNLQSLLLRVPVGKIPAAVASWLYGSHAKREAPATSLSSTQEANQEVMRMRRDLYEEAKQSKDLDYAPTIDNDKLEIKTNSEGQKDSHAGHKDPDLSNFEDLAKLETGIARVKRTLIMDA